jgi:glycerol-3-phosphate dehydrogenase (NAD(P)+)
MTEILEDVFPELSTAVLSGPNHAEEVARSIPSATVIASREPEIAERLQSILLRNLNGEQGKLGRDQGGW